MKQVLFSSADVSSKDSLISVELKGEMNGEEFDLIVQKSHVGDSLEIR